MRKFVFILLIIHCSLLTVRADWVQVNNGLNILNVNALTAYTSGSINYLFAGTQWGQNSGIFLTTNNGDSWSLNFNPNTDIFSLAASNSGGVNYIYAGCANSFYRSTNNGTNWNNIIFPNGSHWYYSVAASGNYVFAGCKWWSNDSGGVYRSTNFGINWVKTSFPTFPFNDVYGLAINGSNVYAGGSGIFVSTDYGSNWLNTSSVITGLSFAINGNYIFVGGGGNGGVWLSTNNGMNWSQTSLNTGTINGLAVYGNAIFAGGPGVWVSTNNGLNWAARNEGWFSTAEDLCISNGFIFAGTSGGGVFRRPLSELLAIKPISEEIPKKYKLFQNYPNPFNPVTNISFDISSSANVKLIIYNMLGGEVEALVNENLRPGRYTFDWNANNFASGTYIYRMVIDDQIIA